MRTRMMAAFVAIPAAFLSAQGGPPRSPAGTTPVVRRSLGYWPTGFEDPDAAFARLREAANMAFVQKLAFDAGALTGSRHALWLTRARQEGMALFVALEIFAGPDRSSLRWPPGAQGPPASCADPAWRQAWRQACAGIASDWHPEYLCVAVEANMYYAAHPAEWPAFREAFNLVRSAVRAVSPDTRIFVSFQLEHLNGSASSGATQWELFDPALALDQDLLGVSTYPPFVAPGLDPALIPSAYVRSLRDRSPLPVFVAETGWHSSGAGVPASSEARQADMVRRLRVLLSGVDLEGYCWVNLVDPPSTKAISAYFQNHPTLATLSLLHSNGNPKEGWNEWLALDNAFPPPGTLNLIVAGASQLTVSGSLASGATLVIDVQGALPLAPAGLGISYAPGSSFISYGSLGGFDVGLAEPFAAILLGSSDAGGHSTLSAHIPPGYLPALPPGPIIIRAVAVDLALQPHPHVICTLSNLAVVSTGG